MVVRMRLLKHPNKPPKINTIAYKSAILHAKKSKRVPVKMPRVINYYNEKHFENLSSCLDKIRRHIKNNCKVFLDFSETEKITAAAMLSLLSEVDQHTRLSPHGYNSISFNHPKNEKIESILKQVGFYDLLRKKKRETKEFDDVVFWRYTSGVCSEPFLAQDTIQAIQKELEMKASKKLYRGFSEAMANSVEHAYASNRCLDKIDVNTATEKWWCFAGIKDEKLILVICDKGVGIPNTLPKTQAGLLQKIFEGLGIKTRTDSAFIKAASNLRETRTGLANRGKGIHDMKAVIDAHESGLLTIFSNRGYYGYTGNSGNIADFVIDYKHSVRGTIIEWSLPLKDKESTMLEGAV
ncbi:ATP-binding protein [Aeromonas caviae]|uniref:ATP-binding protein n=2 Tax=Aeromonas caviae TaxID=648 RepID=UPI002252F2C3|nr:ATP-binding protein [Aeromonas caviae]MCX4031827.1 ATP-binding protein [Aeromonas caviae]